MTTMKNYDKENEQLKYLKDIVDIGYLLNSLGFDVKESATEFRGPCIIHGGDNKTSFRFHKERRTWVCFTKRCNEGNGVGNDIIGLIRSVNRCDFLDAVAYLKQLTGNVDIDERGRVEYFRQKEKESFIGRTLKAEKPKIVSEKCLSQFKPFRTNFFIEQGFSRETLDYFEIAGGYTDSHGNIRDVIPIRNMDGFLEAYSLRDTSTISDEDYKYLLTKGFNKDSVLYNLNNVLDYSETKPLILVEGFKSVWRLKEYGVPNVVAVMGSCITHGQVNLVCASGFRRVIVMFDNDKAGVTGALTTNDFLKDKVYVDIIFITEDGADPSDLSKEAIDGYLKGLI